MFNYSSFSILLLDFSAFPYVFGFITELFFNLWENTALFTSAESLLWQTLSIFMISNHYIKGIASQLHSIQHESKDGQLIINNSISRETQS